MVDEHKKEGLWQRFNNWYGTEVRTGGIEEPSYAHFSQGHHNYPLDALPPVIYETREEVTVDAALSMSAVYRGVDILCTSVSQLELGVWRGINEVPNTPNIVSRPDVNSSPSSFLKRTTMSLVCTGNAYWRLYRDDPVSQPASIEVLNPNLVSISYDKNGKKFFTYTGYGKEVHFPAWQVKHLKLMEVFGTEYGLGPIQAAKGELAGHADLQKYAVKVFDEYPSGVVSTKDHLDAEMAGAYKKRWYEGRNNGERIQFMGNGMTYQPIMLDPEAAQFIQTQNFSITQVARMLGIPANYLLADAGNSQTYQNMEQVDTAFVKYTLTGYLREIEEAFTDILPRGQRARFKVEGFLRADDKTRAEVNKLYVDMKVLTTEEVRISEGWGPSPDELKTPEVAPQAPNAAPPQAVVPEGEVNA